jgi:alkanesulfonate monooxygenase SsuD/methylene tetrahydromethanopterin reductase-like flavin-dependent oxidoreductase (luciferase family)
MKRMSHPTKRVRTSVPVWILAGLSLAAMALAGGWQKSRAAAATYQVLDPDLTALRQRFNADSDQVRVLLLLSPT